MNLLSEGISRKHLGEIGDITNLVIILFLFLFTFLSLPNLCFYMKAVNKTKMFITALLFMSYLRPAPTIYHIIEVQTYSDY